MPGRQQVPGGGLVAVQRGDAGRGERCAQRGRQILGEAGGAAAPRRLVRHLDHLLVPAAREERAQGAGGGGCHAGVEVHGLILLRPSAGSGLPSPAPAPPPRPAPSLNDEGALARPSLALPGASGQRILRPMSIVKNHTVPSMSP